MTHNSKLLLHSREMHKFMELNYIETMHDLFCISDKDIISMPTFPQRLLDEWKLLRDKFNLLMEN